MYKRKTREMPIQQKQAIKQSLTGRSLSASHKEKISQALRDYWATIPPKSEGDSQKSTNNSTENGGNNNEN